MDIIVSITEFRSLSRSELVMRHVLSTLQIGTTTHSGRGILVHGARFRSGTMEDPLVLTLKNRQTDEVMFVRNIPICTVLERSGLFETWVAVYPPGDPQNFHFDAATTPKEGVPAVCVSVAVEEDALPGCSASCSSQHRPSLGFEPAPRRPGENGSSSSKAGEPHSRGFSTMSPRLLSSAWSPTLRSPSSKEDVGGIVMDSTVREKELQAQQIKDHVHEMANAQKRAKDTSRNLQENSRILDDLRRQFKGLELQLAEQQAAIKIIQSDGAHFHQEEAQVSDQIRQRDSAFQELRSHRDEIDRELSHALSEAERQKSALETSSRDFALQAQTMVVDIEHSKQQVSQLEASLASRERMVADSERMVHDEEMRCAAAAARIESERESLRGALKQAQSDLSSTQAALKGHQQQCLAADLCHKETSVCLAAIESELACCQDAIRKQSSDGSSYAQQVRDAQADIDAKRDKLAMHVAKVGQLEGELKRNRGQLDKMSGRIADLRSEAHEKHLAATRCGNTCMDLEAQLDQTRFCTATAVAKKGVHEDQLLKAEQELEQSKAALIALEGSVAQASRQTQEVDELERSIQKKRDELASAQESAGVLQRACESLQATADSQKAALRDRDALVAAARARCAELEQGLAEVSGERAARGSAARQHERDVLRSAEAIEEVKLCVRERLQAITAMRTEMLKSMETGNSRLSDLDTTASVAEQDLKSVTDQLELSDMQRVELETSMMESQKTLARLQNEIGTLLSAKQEKELDISALTHQHEVMITRFQENQKELVHLEEASQMQEADLESTIKLRASLVQEMADIELVYRGNMQRMESDVAAWMAERADIDGVNAGLRAELGQLQAGYREAGECVALARGRKEELDAELWRMTAERATMLQGSKDAIMFTEAEVQEAATHFHLSAGLEEDAEKRLQGRVADAGVVRAGLARARERAGAETDRLWEVQAELRARQEVLATTQAQLERHTAEGAALEATSGGLEQEVARLRALLGSAEPAHLNEQIFRLRHAEILAEGRAAEARHQDELACRERQACDAQEQLERHGAEQLQRKDEELGRQRAQISRLEAERLSLTQQVERLEAERLQLVGQVGESEDAQRDAAAEAHHKVHECEKLEGTIRETKSLSSHFEQREQELEQVLAGIGQREVALRDEIQEQSVQSREIQAEMEAADRDAAAEIESEVERIADQLQANVAAEHECEQLRQELEQLTVETSSLTRELETVDIDTDSLQKAVVCAQDELADAVAESELQRRIMAEQAQELERRACERQKCNEVEALRRTVQELEGSLQQLTDRLVEAQDAVRHRRTEKDEAWVDIQKLKESVRVMVDKIAYQVEHGNLQFETMQKLGEHKQHAEGEVEVLTLGLHDAEQGNEYLQKENSILQQQVEGLCDGSLQEWEADVHRAQVAAEVAGYQGEIDTWKQTVDHKRKEKQEELNRLQKQHDDAVQMLRDHIVKLQAEIDQVEQTVKRREAALAKRREQGEPPAPTPNGMPGLVVPQRPLSSGHQRRKALLIGTNYASSHAPLKGCVNDVWNLQCLLRYTLQYSADQLRLLIDCADGRQQRPDRAPTKANIVAGLEWLVAGTQPGDNLLLVFSGYGAQHPRCPGSEEYEAYLVPSDFAEDLPADFFGSDASRLRAASDVGAGYRLLSMLQLNDYISRLPKACRMSVVLDCCYSALPSVSPANNFPATFSKVARGHIDYVKLRDFISRPRFLELPELPVQHTPAHLRASTFPSCGLHCFSGCRLEQWCAEFPIEGTVQGAFSWAFLKALARGHFHCGLYQFQEMVVELLKDLKVHFKGVEQTPLLQLSQGASMQNVVLWT